MCPSELVLAEYADGALTEDTASELEKHFELCKPCRQRTAALKAENRLLIQSLQGIDEREMEQEPEREASTQLVTMGLSAAVLTGVAILLRAGFGLIRNLDLPPGLDGLNPMTLSGQLNWLANGFFYILEEGDSILKSLVNRASLAILSLLIMGGLVGLTRLKIRSAAVLGLVSLMLAFVVPAYAVDIRKAEQGRTSVLVGPEETVNDTLMAFGETVEIKGTVAGDLIAFARQVTVRGSVQGNVIAFALRIDVAGNVDGGVFMFGQSVQANGRIGRDLWGIGGLVTVGRDIRMDNNAVLFGGNASIDGDVGRDAMAFVGSLDVGSKIGRDLSFRGERLLVRAPSTIGRDLNSMTRSEKAVTIEPGVTIAGKKTVAFLKSPESRYSTFDFYMKQALRICAAFVTGLLLFWLFPAISRVSISNVRSLLTSGGVGFLALVAIPAASVLLAITLIGLPIAVIAFALWLVCLYLAKIVVAKYIGGAIVSSGGKRSAALALLAGLIIVILAVNLPYIGGVFNFLLSLIGLGTLVLTIYRVSGWGSRSEQANPASL